ncbi:hypothetical protein [[Clostridium] polysaccharolyticum]|uniref:Uncharacterized protein n=1 Tax=[Clostridium] polysaccharolyticum TaxID=29364 RepID=A0A1I0DDN2_9FIRM|nr:hypothetical protein [[Clostridium] polysaccharolyticum]SET30462.1 hypothetical protein SAMN04487772_11423 [[Clostridium] polysaccharolyticum]
MLRKKIFEGLAHCTLEPVLGTEQWYSCIESPLTFYQASEMFRNEGEYQGTMCSLLHFPDGKKHCPLTIEKNRYIAPPVYDEGKLAFLAADFERKKFQILYYQPEKQKLTLLAEVTLDIQQEYTNLSLKTRPLLLGYKPKEDSYRVIWPETCEIPIEKNEVFMFRDLDNLYFQKDATSKEPSCVLIRDLHTGQIKNRMTGKMYPMPDGRFWVFS